MKAWIWYRCLNRIANYYHQDEEQLGFYKKVHSMHEKITDIKTKSISKKKKDFFVISHRNKRMSFNLFDKNCAQENVQLHLQHGESWLGGIVIEQVNYKSPVYVSWKKLCLHTFKDPLGRSNPDVFLENEGKVYEGGCVWKSFFRQLAGWHLGTSLRINLFPYNF